MPTPADPEATTSAEPSVPAPAGFRRAYRYCQFHHAGRFCWGHGVVELTEEATAIKWLTCQDHSDHRPPIATDNRWRRPSRCAQG